MSGIRRVFACGMMAALTALLPATNARGQTMTQAKDLFIKHCAVCHGDKGDAQTQAGKTLSPPPRDFTDPQVAVKLTSRQMFDAIKNGKPGTAMAPWKARLSDTQINGLTGYIRERLMLPTRAPQATLGQTLYHRNCSVCHGDRGDGASAAAQGLRKKPRDFTSEKARKELSRDRMIFAATYGVPDTPMAGFGKKLSQSQIATIVDYIRATFMKVEAEPAAQAAQDTSGPKYMAQPMPKNLAGDAAQGKIIYENNCYICHGLTGDGKGPRAYFINPKPRDFTHPASRRALNRPTLFTHIGEGIRGTEMSAWSKVLTDQQVANVAEYVFQTFIDSPRRAP
ncbi:MAG: c-type cytochrome [Nitrospinae bacterium]|nr:c-type cytochrome [Nitrospinota bacterium]